MKKKKGIVQPKKFVARLRKDNDAFDNFSQQDAHEFLNYLLNTCADLLTAEMNELKELQRVEEMNRTDSNVRLNIKAYRSLHKATVNTNGAIINASAATTAAAVAGGSKRNSSINGSNRSLSSQNSHQSAKNNAAEGGQSGSAVNGGDRPSELTWIHELFQGILVNETKCLNCETVRFFGLNGWKRFQK
jgi:ubiquitin carboxyl-terminal hydrolase 12/46